MPHTLLASEFTHILGLPFDEQLSQLVENTSKKLNLQIDRVVQQHELVFLNQLIDLKKFPVSKLSFQVNSDILKDLEFSKLLNNLNSTEFEHLELVIDNPSMVD